MCWRVIWLATSHFLFPPFASCTGRVCSGSTTRLYIMYLRGEEELSFYGCHLCIVYKRLYRQPCSQLMQRTPQQLLHCLSLFIGSIRQYMSVVVKVFHYASHSTRLLFFVFCFVSFSIVDWGLYQKCWWLITHRSLQLREYTCLHCNKNQAINFTSSLYNRLLYLFITMALRLLILKAYNVRSLKTLQHEWCDRYIRW